VLNFVPTVNGAGWTQACRESNYAYGLLGCEGARRGRRAWSVRRRTPLGVLSRQPVRRQCLCGFGDGATRQESVRERQESRQRSVGAWSVERVLDGVQRC